MSKKVMQVGKWVEVNAYVSLLLSAPEPLSFGGTRRTVHALWTPANDLKARWFIGWVDETEGVGIVASYEMVGEQRFTSRKDAYVWLAAKFHEAMDEAAMLQREQEEG